MAYVYGLFYKEDSIEKCFYIGKGNGHRMNLHLSKTFDHNNSYKENKIKKLREENKGVFAKKIKKNISDKLAYELEEFIINEIGLDNLTNLDSGGLGASSGKCNHNYGKQRDKNTRNKISKSLKGRSRSKEAKEKMSESHKGKTLSKKHRKKIGKSGRKSNGSKIDNEIAKEIKWLLDNTHKKHQEIADSYDNATIHIVSDISSGKTFDYLKPKKPKKWTPSKKSMAKWLYQNTDLTQREVGEIFDVSRTSVGKWVNNNKIKSRISNKYKQVYV